MQEKESIEKEEFTVQPYNGKELANHYGVDPKTFRRWLKLLKADLGTRIGNYYSPNQVKIIVEKLGKPFSWIGVLAAKVFGSEFFDHDDDHPWGGGGGPGQMLK